MNAAKIISLGCLMNIAESEQMRAMLASESDLVVVNSSAVTGKALRQTRKAIRRARAAHPKARLVVTGCAAEVDRAAIGAMDEVDGLVANAAKLDPRAWNAAADPPRLAPAPTRAFVAVKNSSDSASTFSVTSKHLKRRYLRRDALELAAQRKGLRPDIANGADLIAGFPTESEAHHAANLAIMDDLDIAHAHIFPFSPCPGTPAARMPQVSREVMKARAAELPARAAARRAMWLQSLVGETLAVLAERDGSRYAPNYARVAPPAETAAGNVIEVNVREVREGLLV